MKRTAKLIGGVAAVVVLATACGSDTTVEAGPATSAPATTAPATTAPATTAPATSAPATTAEPGGSDGTTAPTVPEAPAVDTTEARAAWAAAGLSDYVLRQTYSCFCPEEFTGPFRVDVIDGEIVAVEHMGAVAAAADAPVATIEQLFDAIDDAVRDGAERIDVAFDNATGVPLSVFVDVEALMADEEYGWTTELLPDQTPTADGAAPTGDALAGEPFDGPKAPAGASLIVIGVAADDVLNVRSGPGVEAEIVTTLGPTATATATGEARLLPGSLWFEVTTADSVTGWVNRAFVAQPGIVSDVTSEVVAALDGAVATAGSFDELAQVVAATRASDDPPSTITFVDAVEGEPSEFVVDVVGFGDDSVLGERLVIFADFIGEGAGGWAAGTVEAITLCARGVTEDGLCI